MAEKILSLGPVDPAALPSDGETEKKAPWLVRKLVGSMTGRIVMSSYESLRAAGTNVVCLSPGGMAAVAAPAMGPISDVVIASVGESIFVELGLHAGFEISAKAANSLVFNRPASKLIPVHSDILNTTAVKVLLITLKYKHTMEDASLGFYRSSLHKLSVLDALETMDMSLFSSIKDYLAVEKGWFSPYLFASARRPIIPRNMKPDVIFCHGPFLPGDYRIGETLLAQSAMAITLCDPPTPVSSSLLTTTEIKGEEHRFDNDHDDDSHGDDDHDLRACFSSLKSHLSDFSHSYSDLRNPARSPSPTPPARLTPPRRIVILLLGLKPHRKLWTTSARPGESVINYILFNGSPAIVAPAVSHSNKTNAAPLVAWYAGMTLEQLWDVEIPEKVGEGDFNIHPHKEEEESDSVNEMSLKTFKGVVQVLFEYLDLCIDWERVKLPPNETPITTCGFIPPSTTTDNDLEKKKTTLRNALALLVSSAIKSGNNMEAMKEVNKERSGIAMWRIP